MAVWYLDDDHFLDEDSQAESKMTFDVSFGTISDVDVFAGTEARIRFDITMDIVGNLGLDLLDLIPEDFTSSIILQEYVEECSIQVGNWMSLSRDIIKLLSPNTTTSMTYLRELGSIIGVKFPPEDETSEVEMRRVLEDAVAWYRAKGTYHSLSIIALIYQRTINIYDMYTNDYSTFYLVDWFVGDEDENPAGFDSTYYKSPHFGVEVVLNRVITSGSINYLWEDDGDITNFKNEVERTRPVHTVPHYLLFLNPQTDEFGNIITTSGNVQAKITGNWNPTQKFFDDTAAWNFDDGTIFDLNATALINSITKWVMGTGNYPSDLADTGFVIEGASITGTIDDIVITDEKVTFEFLVPKATIASNLSSLGLYIPGVPDQLMCAATFPKINKSDEAELRVKVEVSKTDLS